MKTLSKLIPAIMLLAAATVTSCKKQENQTASMAVRMKDAPSIGSPYFEVNVEIKEVQVHFTNELGWQSIKTSAGVYNLLNYRNNVFAPLAWDDKLAEGRIDQVRLVPGTNNYVVDKNGRRDMVLSSDAAQRLTIPIDVALAHRYEVDLMLEFDANNSVVDNGGIVVTLSPNLRIVEKMTM